MSDRWETMLQSWQGQCDKHYLDAMSFVGDAVFMAWLWWDAKHPELQATPADLIAMAAQIQAHHHAGGRGGGAGLRGAGDGRHHRARGGRDMRGAQ